MKVWLFVFLTYLPNNQVLHGVKTVVSLEECQELMAGAHKAAEGDGLEAEGQCAAYDGRDEELEALKVISEMLRLRGSAKL